MDAAVFRSLNSRCCIVIGESDRTVQYISIEEGGGELIIDVRKMDAREFHDEYKELPEYPVARAVNHFLNPVTPAIRATERASKLLNQLRTDKGIAMTDATRLSLSERNIAATLKAGIAHTGSKPRVAEVAVAEQVPGSSKKQTKTKGTYDVKETLTELNSAAQRKAIKAHNAKKQKEARKAERLANRQKRKNMNDQAAPQATTEDTTNERQEPAQATPKAAKKAVTKTASKEASPKTTSKKSTTQEQTAMNDTTAKKTAAKKATKTTDAKAAKKTTAKKGEPKVAKKAAAKKAEPKAAKKAAKKAAPAKATKLAKGTGKGAAATKKAAGGKKDKGQEGARRGRKGAFDESQKIKVLVKDNPKREGSASYDIFELLKKSKTVGDFFASGGASSNLHWNIERGYIEVE